MTDILSYQPGQTATIVKQVFADGYRSDGYLGAPIIARIILPGFTLASGFPATMTKLDTGLYTYSFVIPTGAVAVGLYIVDIYWYDPITFALQQDAVLLNVSAPYGIYSATVKS